MKKLNLFSLMFCMSFFACSDSEDGLIPEPEVGTPQEDSQKPASVIQQKDYISDPALWQGPSLSKKGFVVEIEMGAEQSVRSSEITRKSVEKYEVGEHQSALPAIKAAEWGYTVLNLRSGNYDGAGRLIDNFYLDNIDQIADRKQALETIMRFVKKQYQVKGFLPWYSMNGHHCWHHYAGDAGCKVLGSEIGENIHGYQLHLAMNRGAAKQYNAAWTMDFSSWHGPSILDYSNGKIWKEYSGARHGHSINLVERSMLMSFMGGADGVVAEAGGAICFMDTKNQDGCYQLSPYGKVFQKLNKFSKQHQVGITYTPVAVLLDHYHGMDRQPSGQKAFGKFAYNEGDRETFKLIETIWPQTFDVERNGNELGAMVNGKYPDAVDFLLQGASLKLLNTYKAVILSGDMHLSPTEINDLKTYAEKGGVVLGTQRNIEQLGFKGGADAGVVEETLGKGKLVAFKTSALRTVLKKYLTDVMPVQIQGDVQYFVNVADGALFVTVINNEGVTKLPKSMPVIDSSKKKDVKLTFKLADKISSAQEIWNARQLNVQGNTISFSLEPGECYVIKLS